MVKTEKNNYIKLKSNSHSDIDVIHGINEKHFLQRKNNYFFTFLL